MKLPAGESQSLHRAAIITGASGFTTLLGESYTWHYWNDLRVDHDHGRRSDLVVRRSREQKMTDPAAIAAIIDQYVKHGWKLRRVLVTRELSEALGSSEIFAGADVRPSQYDGMWFSRRSLPDREAWELRRISAAPFAVVEVIPDEFTDQERDEVLSEAEDRMFDAARTKETSH